ncbi:MAG TPA: FISUMP domain-containing protein, partial [Bacteroidales bacterium]|nr:FISUMP domain-containing protein [Bacteroidales bacterium]
IGTKVWMGENLRVTKYNDGTDIPLVTNGTTWAYLTGPGYCWYANDQASNGDTYGALYNWYAVNTLKLCPSGWHMPSEAEWTALTTYTGGLSVAGGKLKETGTLHWTSPNTGATDESGFTALPGGIRLGDGAYSSLGSQGVFWSSDSVSNALAHSLGLTFNSSAAMNSTNGTTQGLSVRCICNFGAQINEIKNNIEINIFPNPFSDYATLSLSKPLFNASLIVYDIIGKEVNRIENLNAKEIRISRNGMSKGMYFFRVVDGNINVGKGKMIIE